MTEPEGPGKAAPPPTVIRVACVLLLVVGFGSVLLSLQGLADPAGTRCRLSRVHVNQANTDSKPWNNVDTGGRKAKDLPCADALRLAGQIRLNQKGTRTASVPSEAAVRVQGAFTILIGLGQGLTGALLARTLSRPARNAAIGFVAFGLVLPVLGFISFGVAIFVIYALIASPAAKELWGRPRGGNAA
jgi:hypothetical protein